MVPDRVWVDQNGRLFHVRELRNSHLRRLIKMMRNRRNRSTLQMESAMSKIDSNRNDPEICSSQLQHHAELETIFKESGEWLTTFEEEKSRRNMIDTVIDVEFL